MAGVSGCKALGVVLLAVLAFPLYYTFMPPQVHEVKGKCAVITGASTGIGVQIAHVLASEGVSKLVITARSKERLDAVAANITKHYPETQVFAVKSDVSKPEDRTALAETVAKTFGSCPTILVNNAGVEHFLHMELQSVKPKIDQMIDINIRGLIHLTNDFLPMLMKSGGHIVNIASLAGKATGIGVNVYAATKYAVVGFSLNLRADMRHRKLGVSVHCVMPGIVTEAGMAHDMGKQIGLSLESVTDLFGSSRPIDIAHAVVEAIRYDHPEIIVNSLPVWPLTAIQTLFPRVWDFFWDLPLPLVQRATAWVDKVTDYQSQN
ncbi:unnamed protein product [Polarella glacialis]|uniref:Uncharacterized protein n=1 Tax=Polarella glacialis TaxID=89957 RepID=A0A813F1E0_POLGL|nr:unnamed protein product [Polarella glacialis]CAE8717113.1 unnamed protein product [Polarella glacialis]